ncbi:hypothetical protein BJ138DRAFT_1176704 [Hygrophoropsis aurantiaca]|uniref:Uncharacterized protein n=1 Tax=Hygrophoropsis aurantiaca TaxID=72124 RepID=A0ACB8AP95_9AGAM|nr:hypothetical protein BJ138DRAFT_1176704 [Hygrophoropsis aurantiaca]
MNHELQSAATECLASIRRFGCVLQQHYPGIDNTDELDGNALMVKLHDWKKPVEDLRFTLQSHSSSPLVLKEALTAVTDKVAKFAEHFNASAHILRLPIEILQMIFELAGRFSSDPNFPCTYDVQPSELDISHVSRRWRDIAIHTPSLWTKWGEHVTRSNNLLSIYFHRSCNRKVDVELCHWKAQTQMSVCHACSSEGQTGKYHVASELLEISMHRFRSLKISVITTSLAKLVEQIALTVSSSLTPSFMSLASLSIRADFIDDLYERETLLNFEEFRNILSACPNLTVLELSDAVISRSEIMDLARTECIALPSLMRLCFDTGDDLPDLYTISILATLKAPKLRHFDCRHIFPEEDADQLWYALFNSDHTPRFPSVRELSLHTASTCDEKNILLAGDVFFDVVVKAFPNVTDVILANTDVMQCGMALAEITEPSTGGSAVDPWPCLQRLSLDKPSRNGLPAIRRWLKSRAIRIRQPQALSFKVIGPFGDPSNEDALCLKEMEIHGDLTLENIVLEELQSFEEHWLNANEEEIIDHT